MKFENIKTKHITSNIYLKEIEKNSKMNFYSNCKNLRMR